jgi:hypothetical protein
MFLLAGVFLLSVPHNVFAKFVPEAHTMVRTNTAPKTDWRTIKVHPGPRAPKIHFYDKLNPVWWFKNCDDPRPPAWYRPDDPHRKVWWSFRNPLHNFNFYVIGVGDKTFYRSGRFPGQNANPHGGWDFEAARYKFIWLPFVAYHRTNFDFYFGWRNHGNFGIKINGGSKQEVGKGTVPADDSEKQAEPGNN